MDRQQIPDGSHTSTKAGMDTLVSILTPTFNHEQYIAECIESVQAQTYSNWEMIIVDDGSRDKTVEIARAFAEKDSRIEIIEHKTNYGLYRLHETYNEALRLSKGELIAILETDDLWRANKLELQVPYFADPEVVLVYANAALTKIDRTLIRNTKLETDLQKDKCLTNYPVGVAYKRLLFGRNPIINVTAVVRKQVLEAIGGFACLPGLAGADFATWLELTGEGQFAFVQEIVATHRRHKNAATMGRLSVKSIEAAMKWTESPHCLESEPWRKAGFDSREMLQTAQRKILARRKLLHNLQRASKAMEVDDWDTARDELKQHLSHDPNPLRRTVVGVVRFFAGYKINLLRSAKALVPERFRS